MRYSLRDLLWLTILVAAGTTWWQDYRPMAEEQRRLYALRAPRNQSHELDPATLTRLAVVTKFANFTDAQLAARLETLVAEPQPRSEEYEPCLCEMAKRRMVVELREQLAAVRARSKPQVGQFPDPADLEVLTALRRAENLPDPLAIDVTAFKDEEQRRWSPMLAADVENVDTKRESYILVRSGDYRGGRPERWRFSLTDEQGKQVPEIDFFSIMGGGISQTGPFPHGEKYGPYQFDLRAYLKPPAPGKYTLQVYYHNHRLIASEPNLSGLIVSQSAPIPVQVIGPSLTPQQRFARWLPLILIAMALIVLLYCAYERSFARSVDRRLLLRRRDIAWCLLLVSIGLGWGSLQYYGYKSIDSLRNERDPQWQIELLDA